MLHYINLLSLLEPKADLLSRAALSYKAARNRPLSEAQRLVNKAISRVRGKVERAFGTLKKDHRMARARYLGTAKVGLQLLLDAMAFNLKKAARLAWA